METIHDFGGLPRPLDFPVVTVGVFDGVHLGHQEIIREVTAYAERKRGKSVIITFDPHPEEVLFGKPLCFLSSLEHRLVLFERMGIDYTIVVRFDKEFAATGAEDFVKAVLVEAIGARAVITGFDNRFGRGGQGDFELLKSLGAKYGFEVKGIPPLKVGREVVSSSRIRDLIAGGELERAERMLGREVSILGTVVQGTGKGRELGFPTANIDPHHEVKPPAGVYLSRAFMGGKEVGSGSITNIGRRPTFDRGKEDVIEVYVLDFEGVLYGRDIEIRFLKKIRDEAKYSSEEALREQIAKDVKRALIAKVEAATAPRG